MHPRNLQAWERRLIISLYVALACGDTYHFLCNEFVLVFTVFFCLLMKCSVFFFSFKEKKNGIWSTFPRPSYLLILPSRMSTAPYGHILLQSFSAAWLFSEQIWNCCSCGFLKINFVMVLKEKSKCIVALSFLIKEKYRKKIGNTSKLYVDKF